MPWTLNALVSRLDNSRVSCAVVFDQVVLILGCGFTLERGRIVFVEAGVDYMEDFRSLLL